MALSPFQWGAGGRKISSPAEAARQREIAEALIGRSSKPAQNWAEGLSHLAGAWSGSQLQNQAAAAEEEGQRAVAELLAGISPDSNFEDLNAVLSNQWASPQQSAVAQALLGQQLQNNDPMRQMELERTAIELERLRNPAAPGPDFGFMTMPDGTLVRTDSTSGGIEPLGNYAGGSENGLINAGGGNIYNPNTGEWITAPGGIEPDMTDTQRNLEWRAAQAGLTPGTPEYQQFMMTGGQGGTSLSVDPATGAVSFTQGFGAKPLTEGQSKDTVYVTRASGALPTLDAVGIALTDPIQHAMGADPTGVIRGNQTPEFQMAQQAGLEFLQAILRKDTGAAITPAETEEYGKVYLPRPGDTPEVLEQKRQSRQRAIAAIEAGLPASAILRSEEALLQATESTVAPEGSQGQAQPSSMSQMATPTSEAEFNALPSGTPFRAPDGSIRIKP